MNRTNTFMEWVWIKLGWQEHPWHPHVWRFGRLHHGMPVKKCRYPGCHRWTAPWV